MYIAGLVILALTRSLNQSTVAIAAKLAAVVLVCAAVYIVAARALGVRELALLTGKRDD
jgi:hypothetical protein